MSMFQPFGVESAAGSRCLDPGKRALDPVKRGRCRIRHVGWIGWLYPRRNPARLTHAPARPIGTPTSIRRAVARLNAPRAGPKGDMP